MIEFGFYTSPLGEGAAVWNKEGVLRVSFPGVAADVFLSETRQAFGEIREGSALILDELTAYFQGALRSFRSRPVFRGSGFQTRVWEALTEIPYGATRTYGELARAIGSPKAARAVGGACGRNRVPILVPCHRVVAGSGLGGFGGGLGMKRWLLDFERMRLADE